MKGLLPKRHEDKWGSGAYGAPRGDRTHNGIDFVAEPGTMIYPDKFGEVTKLGYPYGDDTSFRYVEVTDENGYRLRYFYLIPVVKVGQRVDKDTVIGAVQDLTTRYPGIKNHVHLEIKLPDGSYVNPSEYL